ncbi:hypothetical protein [Amycolatopsis sp. cmx-4-61]|uniref:hypothetical protein n=1 Tax=Amycolatopsis sp. cmx-4-61 TaxID=2790937 RepID=UPI00397B111A
MDVSSVPAQSFRANQAYYFAEVKTGAHIALTRYGPTVAVVLPPRDYRRAMSALRAVAGFGEHAEQQWRLGNRDVQKVSAAVFRRDQADYLDVLENGATHVAVTRYQDTLGVVLPYADYEYAMFAVRVMDGLAKLAESNGPHDLQAFAALVDQEMSHREARVGQQQLLLFKEVAQAS